MYATGRPTMDALLSRSMVPPGPGASNNEGQREEACLPEVRYMYDRSP